MKITITFICMLTASALSVSAQEAVWRVGNQFVSDTQHVRVPLQPPRTARILFAGDLMQHMPQISAARRADGTFDYSASFEYIEPLFSAADLVVVNLETTLTQTGDYSGYPCFRSPTALAPALHQAGVDVCMLANNHCCDGGGNGIRTTQYELKHAGIAYTGVFADTARCHVLRLQVAGIRLALLNYTYGTNGIHVPQGFNVACIDTLRMAVDLRCARRESDCVVVCIHWGNEYSRQPDRSQCELARFLHRHGSCLVIGSHPHVVQPYEVDDSGVVFYSLGNLVSNQRRRYCDGGIIADIRLTVESDGRLSVQANAIPIWVDLPQYRILPSSVADTLSMTASDRAAYERFSQDTRLLLSYQ